VCRCLPGAGILFINSTNNGVVFPEKREIIKRLILVFMKLFLQLLASSTARRSPSRKL